MNAIEKVELGEWATLYCGDCLDVLPTLEREGIDVVITDPPYGIPHKFGTQKHQPGKGSRRLQFDWDSEETTAQVLEVVKISTGFGRSHLWFCGLHQASYIADQLLADGFTSKPAAWVKTCPPPAGKGNWWPSAFELAVYGYRSGAYFGDLDTCRSNVWVYDSYRYGQPGKCGHPTQKPLKLMAHIISGMVPPDGCILDCYAGSGSTGVAAVRLGRKFTGIELEKRWFDVACKRIEAALPENAEPLFEGLEA